MIDFSPAPSRDNLSSLGFTGNPCNPRTLRRKKLLNFSWTQTCDLKYEFSAEFLIISKFWDFYKRFSGFHWFESLKCTSRFSASDHDLFVSMKPEVIVVIRYVRAAILIMKYVYYYCTTCIKRTSSRYHFSFTSSLIVWITHAMNLKIYVRVRRFVCVVFGFLYLSTIKECKEKISKYRLEIASENGLLFRFTKTKRMVLGFLVREQ